MEYTVYRREDAATLMLNLKQLKLRGIEPRMQDYYKFIDREIDAVGNIENIAERIYYELECSGWRISVNALKTRRARLEQRRANPLDSGAGWSRLPDAARARLL